MTEVPPVGAGPPVNATRTPAALVTGGGSGIGAALVARLAAAGRPVAVLDVSPTAAPPGGMSLVVDVADPEALAAAFSRAEAELGAVSEVYLNAGLATDIAGGVEEVPLPRYRRLLGVNVDHVWFGLQLALPALRRAGGGATVVTASLAGLVPLPNDPLYTLTKHAVVGLVRAVGATVAAEGLTVAAVCPGFTETPLLDPLVERFRAASFPLLTAGQVAEAALAAAAGRSGDCWVVQPGRPAAPYRFHGVPGARAAAGQAAAEVPL